MAEQLRRSRWRVRPTTAADYAFYAHHGYGEEGVRLAKRLD